MSDVRYEPCVRARRVRILDLIACGVMVVVSVGVYSATNSGNDVAVVGSSTSDGAAEARFAIAGVGTCVIVALALTVLLSLAKKRPSVLAWLVPVATVLTAVHPLMVWWTVHAHLWLIGWTVLFAVLAMASIGKPVTPRP